MEKKLEKTLVEKYPDALSDYGGDMRQTCMSWGFECGNGWFKILEEFCEKVGNIPGFKFAQVKEKFGILTIYYNGPDSDEDKKIVREALHEAEDKSVVTCETCGEPAKRASTAGWISVECKICKALHDIRRNL